MVTGRGSRASPEEVVRLRAVTGSLRGKHGCAEHRELLLRPDQAAYHLEVIANGRDDPNLASGEAPGRWIGTGAEKFGLGGKADWTPVGGGWGRSGWGAPPGPFRLAMMVRMGNRPWSGGVSPGHVQRLRHPDRRPGAG